MRIEYTQSAKDALKAAKNAAKQLGHSYIGSEHLLLGLLREQHGTAGMVLRDCGLEEEKLLRMIDELIAPEGNTALAGREGYTPRAEAILDNSRGEAVSFHMEEIGTEHILMSLLKDTECVASKLLYTMNVNFQKVFIEVLETMGIGEEMYKELGCQIGRAHV